MDEDIFTGAAYTGKIEGAEEFSGSESFSFRKPGFSSEFLGIKGDKTVRDAKNYVS